MAEDPPHYELLLYRVEQLERRLAAEDRWRRGRPAMIATIVMAIAATAQLGTAVMLLILGKVH